MQRCGSSRPPWASLCWLAWIMLVSVLPGVAQSPRYTVAVLTTGLRFDPVLQGLREGLARAGYEERKNLTLIIEDTKGDMSELAERARRLAQAKPDVLFTVATSATGAARQATTSVPIVFAWVGDPVKSGFVAGYASSKNNLTGVSAYLDPLSGKRLEVLKEVAPRVERVLALVAVKEVISELSFQVLNDAAKKLGVEVLRREVTTRAEIEQSLQETPAGSVDAIYHLPSSLIGTHIHLLIAKAREDKLPLIVTEDWYVEQGALISFGGDFKETGAQAAKLVVKVLKGAKPAELSIQTPEKLVLAINLTTARDIGLTIPREVLERADRLVE